jgi:hypothetical protein
MGRQVVTTVTCDLYPDEPVVEEGVQVTTNRGTYVLDLSERALTEFVVPLVEHGERQVPRARSRSGGGRSRGNGDGSKARAWALSRGMDVPARGRMHSDVLDAWRGAGSPG